MLFFIRRKSGGGSTQYGEQGSTILATTKLNFRISCNFTIVLSMNINKHNKYNFIQKMCIVFYDQGYDQN